MPERVQLFAGVKNVFTLLEVMGKIGRVTWKFTYG